MMLDGDIRGGASSRYAKPLLVKILSLE